MLRRLFLAPIKLYRKHLSQRKSAPCCRFEPSCSKYAYTAINEWGALIGLPMGVFRILRCNPLFRGGYNPVPRKKRKLVPKTAVFGKAARVDNTPVSYPYLTTYGNYI